MKTRALLLIGLIAGCGPGVGEDLPGGTSGTSKLGESCSARADCVSGLTCKSQVCKIDASTNRSCAEIERVYLGAVQNTSNTACTVSSDCAVAKGLCGSDNVEIAAVNKVIKADMDQLDEEWDNNGCDQDVRCAGSLGNGAYCLSGQCILSSKCARAFDAICLDASGYNCGLYSSSFACQSELADLLECDDAQVSDNASTYSTCLSNLQHDCSTKETFLDPVLAQCGTLLGMRKR